MSQQKQEEGGPRDLFLLFVGCSDPDCGKDFHDHLVGWECLAAASPDRDAIFREVLRVPEQFWWHVVDGREMRIIAQSNDTDGEQKH